MAARVEIKYEFREPAVGFFHVCCMSITNYCGGLDFSGKIRAVSMSRKIIVNINFRQLQKHHKNIRERNMDRRRHAACS